MPSATGAGVSSFSIARPIVAFMSATTLATACFPTVPTSDTSFDFRLSETDVRLAQAPKTQRVTSALL
jgi:hypothetical protein